MYARALDIIQDLRERLSIAHDMRDSMEDKNAKLKALNTKINLDLALAHSHLRQKQYELQEAISKKLKAEELLAYISMNDYHKSLAKAVDNLDHPSNLHPTDIPGITAILEQSVAIPATGDMVFSSSAAQVHNSTPTSSAPSSSVTLPSRRSTDGTVLRTTSVPLTPHTSPNLIYRANRSGFPFRDLAHTDNNRSFDPHAYPPSHIVLKKPAK